MNAPTVTIRPVEPGDLPGVLALMKATDLHYYGPGSRQAEDWARACVEGTADTHIHVAFLDGAAVGYACVAVLQPSDGPAGMMFLKELFVDDAARGQGVGEALMVYIAKLAVERGCRRIDWSTRVGNAGARRFYTALGGVEQTDRVYYRLDGEALADLADRAVTP